MVSDTPTPSNYSEAIASLNSSLWHKAMEDKFNSLIANGTWELVPLPTGQNTVDTRWIYKLKLQADGSIEQAKARFITKGYSQCYRIDYNETFAPIMRIEDMHLLLAYANALNLEIHSMDIDSAFLQADLEEKIYITQPEGFVSPQHPDYVCCLKKSLYSLKQAPLAWNKTLDCHLQIQGFQPTLGDLCIYIRKQGRFINLISIYIDDCLLITDSSCISLIKEAITNAFKSKDLGEVMSILGIEVIHNCNMVPPHLPVPVPLAYCNVDWGGNPTSCKLMSGYVFFLSGSPIMWASKVQTTVALSSTEAEYTTLTKAVKQALFMRKMFALLEIDTTYPVWIYCDNQSALTIASQA